MDNNTLQYKVFTFLRKIAQKTKKRSWRQLRFIVPVKKYD